MNGAFYHAWVSVLASCPLPWRCVTYLLTTYDLPHFLRTARCIGPRFIDCLDTYDRLCFVRRASRKPTGCTSIKECGSYVH